MKWMLYGAVLMAGVAAGVLVPSHHVTPVNARLAHNGTAGMIDVDSMCTQEAPGTCHAITRASDAVAVVRARIELSSGGQLPARIDATEETATVAVQSYGEALALPPDRLVWYIRTYAPVTLTAQSGAFLPSNIALHEAHGLGFIVDAATGQDLAMAAFS